MTSPQTPVGVWRTHRGDEWWYSAPWGRATAATAASNVWIDSIQPANGRLTTSELQHLLRSAAEQFAGLSVLCELTKLTRPLIDDLTNAKLLRWELVESPHSRDARILEVSAPASGPNGDAPR